MNTNDWQLLETHAPSLDGILTLPDLKVLFARLGEQGLFKKLNVLTREGVLIKVKRGLYARPTASLEAISQRIEPQSYLTAGTALAKAMLIGSIPARRVTAAKVGRPRTYSCALGTIRHLSLKPELFFGFERIDNLCLAMPEKAFLDACYFRFKGHRFSFDLDTDIDIGMLDESRLHKYLAAYDRRFIAYFTKTWGP